jgi:hypothetical protein
MGYGTKSGDPFNPILHKMEGNRILSYLKFLKTRKIMHSFYLLKITRFPVFAVHSQRTTGSFINRDTQRID